MSPDRTLVIDDEDTVRELVSKVLQRVGLEVDTASSGLAGLEMAGQKEYAVAIVDLSLPGLSGMETVRRLKEIDPDTEVIIYTGYPSVDSSIEAIHEKVFEYICKPASMRDLERGVRRAIERRQLIRQNRELMRQIQSERDGLQHQVAAAKRAFEQRFESSPSFVGKSELVRQVRHFMAEVAPSDMTVLLLGESGVGKDVVARLIHESSGRDPNAFVKINCPAIPETLLESELFGHEPGAFTGAEGRKPGRFELGSGGTVFLDEIGDLPLNLQAKLLQVIEQKQFTRVGGRETISVNVRIIAATNAPMDQMIANGRFRPDLFYRLNEYSIELPSLRSRKEDIPLLVQHFLRNYGAKYNHPDLTISQDTMALLNMYHWPGNVRELESVIRRFALDNNEMSITRALKITEIRPSAQKSAVAVVRDTEIQTIMTALAESRWNLRRTAEMLGMSYSSLRRRIAKYGLKDQSMPAFPVSFDQSNSTWD